MKIKELLFAGFGLLLAGCVSLNVQTVNPRPNINIDKSTQSIALLIGSQVQDTFKIVSAKPIAPGNMVGWHQTLKNGLNNGFTDTYKVVDDKSTSDLVLTIKRADPVFVLSSLAVDAYGSPVGGTIKGQITYAADLSTKDGNVIGRSSGTVQSKKSVFKAKESATVIESAVESMYEAIVADVFKK